MNWSLFTLGLAGVVGLGFSLAGFASVRRQDISLDSYLTNRGKTGTLQSMASLVASVAGAWILFSPAETGTWAGLPGIFGYALGQALPLFVIAVLGARLLKLDPQGSSLGTFLTRRFGKVAGIFTSGLMLFYMLTFLTAELTGIALAFSITLGTPLWVTAAVVMVLTLAYTLYGGLKASISTDFLQFWALLPLLAVIFVAALLLQGGMEKIFIALSNTAPTLLDPLFGPGVEFAAVLVIGITASNLFHQGFWQRVWACRDQATLNRSFLSAGLIILPLIAVSGLFGIMAQGLGLVAPGQASVALFALVQTLPPWVLTITLVLGLILAMSSMDTLLNGIVSVLVSFRKQSTTDSQALGRSRWLTVLVGVPLVAIAAQGFSVLYLFLIADLVCSAAAFPLLFGLYARRINGREAVLAVALGIAAGGPFFPAPGFGAWNPLTPNMLLSFVLALGVSTAAALLFNLAGRKRAAWQAERAA